MHSHRLRKLDFPASVVIFKRHVANFVFGISWTYEKHLTLESLNGKLHNGFNRKKIGNHQKLSKCSLVICQPC